MAQATLFNPAAHSSLISQFADIHIACIESDQMVANFMPPLSHEKVQLWWADKASQVRCEPRSCHIIFMEEDSKATGVVILQLKFSETGDFQGEVQKLLVSPQHRKKGIAKRMMAHVEAVARLEGRTLLLLDTDKDSPADAIYPKWGYRQYGTIPRYERRPNGGFMDATFYYKDLAAADAVSLE